MNNAGQHGRQPTPQAAPPADPRLRNVPANTTVTTTTTTSVTESSGICRDYIWGICAMGAQCIYRHNLEFEAMKETLKFCHDHQNRTGCTRPDCTYLHTSREEENLFLTTGQIPRVLIERYASMSYMSEYGAAPESAPPQMVMYEYIAQPPPPPPPPPPQSAQTGPMIHSPRETQQPQMQANLMVSPMQGPMPSAINGTIQSPMQGTMNGTIQGPVPNPMQGPMQSPMPCSMPIPIQGPMPGPIQGPMPCPIPGPMQGPIQQHPMQGPMMGSTPMPQMPASMQPPPPPPPPPTSSVSTSRMSGPVYTGHPSNSNIVGGHFQPANNQQPLPALFDPTRPPPPLFQKPSNLKRSADDCEAGPSKLRKSETSNESSCEKCVQRLIRIELYNQQIDQIKQENDKIRAENAVKVKDMDQKKRLIQSLLSPEMCRLTEGYIENGLPTPSMSALNSSRPEVLPTATSLLSSLSQPNSNNTSTSSLISSLLGLIVGREREAEPAPPPSDTALLQQLSSRLRPPAANNSSASDLLSSLLEIVRHPPAERNSSENRSTVVSVGNGTARSFSESGSSTVRPYEGTTPSSSRPFEGFGPSPSRPYDGTGPLPSRPYDGTGPSLSRPYDGTGPLPSRPYDGTGPSPSRPYEGAGPSPARPYEGAGPLPSRPYDGTGPSPSRPYEGAGPTPARPYEGAGPSPARPYDGAVASTTYTQMSMGAYEPVRYPPPTPAATAPVKAQYHSAMELSAMPQGARPAPAPSVQIPGPGPYGMPQTHVQAQGPPARPPFYVQMPPYNGANPPYPGMMPQAGRPPMPPPQNPPNNFFFGTRYPNYYPPYQ